VKQLRKRNSEKREKERENERERREDASHVFLCNFQESKANTRVARGEEASSHEGSVLRVLRMNPI